jgi:acyl carrier protein phosphodiesterase
MNYLAHAFLSFNNPTVLVGNMVSDFVKGKQQYSFPPSIQKGIQLHRAIDSFTDTHACTKAAKQYFKPAVGLYAGAFVDVVYDYFLANDATYFTPDVLANFATNTYAVLQQHQSYLPPYFAAMLPFMQQQNWLYNYQFHWGIEKSFMGIARRAKYLQETGTAFDIFVQQENTLRNLYNDFFGELYAHAFKKYTHE